MGLIVKKKVGVSGSVYYRSGDIEITIGDEPVDVAAAVRDKVPERQVLRAASAVKRSLVSAGFCEEVPAEPAAKRAAKGKEE
jgi:hypothetical protein